MKHFFFVAILFSVLHPSGLSAQWVQTNGPYVAYVRCLASSGSTLVVGTTWGLYRSTDDGESWNHAQHMPGSGIYALASIDSFIFAGTDGDGVYSSIDSGANWSRANSGLIGKYRMTWGLAVSGTTLFGFSQFGGAARSTDFGETWTEADSGASSARFYNILTLGSTLYAGTGSGFFTSTDNGIHWSLSTDSPKNLTINALVASGSYFYAATNKGVFRIADSGRTWTQLSDTNFAELIATRDSTLFGGTWVGGVSRSTDNGLNWSAVNNGIFHPRVNAFAESPTSLFVGTYGAVYRTRNNGDSWEVVNHGLQLAGIGTFATSGADLLIGGSGGVFRYAAPGNWDSELRTTGFIQALAVDGNMYLAGGNLGSAFCSTDAGTTWSSNTTSLADVNITSAVVIGTDLFLGTDHRGIFRSSDTNRSWASVNHGLSDTSIRALVALGTRLYAGTAARGIFGSLDSGMTWKRMNNGLADSQIYCLTANGSTLWAGTGNGVFFSSDLGSSWSLTNKGLADTIVFSLAVSGTNIFAGTGFGIFTSTLGSDGWKSVNDGVTFFDGRTLAVSNSNLFAGTSSNGIWWRPLSDLSAPTEKADMTSDITLHPNFPNPFSTATTISFSTAKREYIDVKIFDQLGSECAHLVSGELDAGDHVYQWNALHLSPGVYTFVLRTGFGEVKTVKLIRE
ncbi:MAG: T9SS type A sorting domain-containing protein [Bacteroidota bacterium]|nr:T9SS type A sorting domain-containing protein [Bacteroidota bacterium]